MASAKKEQNSKGVNDAKDHLSWWRAAWKCVGKDLQNAIKADLVHAFEVTAKHLKIPAPIKSRCRLLELNFIEFLSNPTKDGGNRTFLAAALLKPWRLPEETNADCLATLTIGALLKHCEFEDEFEDIASTIEKMYFSTTVYNLAENEVCDNENDDLLQLSLAMLRFDNEIPSHITDSFLDMPDRVLEAFQKVVEASQIVVAIREPTPGLHHTSYRRIAAILRDEAPEQIDSDNPPASETMSFARSLKRSKGYKSVCMKYPHEARHDDEVSGEYWQMVNRMEKVQELNFPWLHSVATFMRDKPNEFQLRTRAWVTLANALLKIWHNLLKSKTEEQLKTLPCEQRDTAVFCLRQIAAMTGVRKSWVAATLDTLKEQQSSFLGAQQTDSLLKLEQSWTIDSDRTELDSITKGLEQQGTEVPESCMKKCHEWRERIMLEIYQVATLTESKKYEEVRFAAESAFFALGRLRGWADWERDHFSHGPAKVFFNRLLQLLDTTVLLKRKWAEMKLEKESESKSDQAMHDLVLELSVPLKTLTDFDLETKVDTAHPVLNKLKKHVCPILKAIGDGLSKDRAHLEVKWGEALGIAEGRLQVVAGGNDKGDDWMQLASVTADSGLESEELRAGLDILQKDCRQQGIEKRIAEVKQAQIFHDTHSRNKTQGIKQMNIKFICASLSRYVCISM